MYFPLIERRIAAQDRRFNTTDRRQSQKSHSLAGNKRKKTARRKGNERRTLILDRETLLYASLLNKEHEPEEKKSKSFLFCSTFLLPLTVAAVSVFATISINNQQVTSAEKLATGQQENAQKIADANIKNSKTIAAAEMETEHLKHLVHIFSTIISPGGNDSEEVIQERIRSLSVYGDEALPFLLQIRQHFSKLDIESLRQKEKSETPINKKEEKALVADRTISAIIKYSQIEVSRQIVSGTPKQHLNLRNKEYINYNLGNSTFSYVNLFGANFYSSSLHGSSFKHVDLVEANFQKTNLADVSFEYANLRKTDFNQAKLKGVTFKDCENIEEAKFSLNTILYAKPGFFGPLKVDQYVLLLMSHEEELVRKNKNEAEKSKLKNILTILKNKYQINSFTELQGKFKQYKSKSFLSKQGASKEADKVSMSNLKAYLKWL